MRARATSTVLEDCRRAIVKLDVDARGPYAILACGHKCRNGKKCRTGETHRWCKSCENRSPYR